jgi:hypothetical protein
MTKNATKPSPDAEVLAEAITVGTSCVSDSLDGIAREAENHAGALRGIFVTPNECDRNGEPAGPTDGLYFVGRGLFAIAKAIGDLAEAVREQGGVA